MISKVKEFVWCLYRLIYEDILCRKEPFTYQLTRAAVKHGIFFWFLFYGIACWCFRNIFQVGGFRDPLHILLGVIVLIFLAWLTDHLLDTVRLHGPEHYN